MNDDNIYLPPRKNTFPSECIKFNIDKLAKLTAISPDCLAGNLSRQNNPIILAEYLDNYPEEAASAFVV